MPHKNTPKFNLTPSMTQCLCTYFYKPNCQTPGSNSRFADPFRCSIEEDLLLWKLSQNLK